VKYGNWVQETSSLDGDTKEYIDKENAFRLESARIKHWHLSFNAALTGIVSVLDTASAIEVATNIADRVHGVL
jgi:hypothetical protein